MAWQNSAGIGGSGGSAGGGSEAGNSGGQPQGTEYTLQGKQNVVQLPSSTEHVKPPTDPFITGVMRFLQTEWHRHERERNAWQIERAEMKSRIGKLEGDGRTNKRLRESMDKHIRLLEHALKNEREKAKSPQSGSQTEGKKEESQAAKQNVRPMSKGRHILALSNHLWLTEPAIPRKTPQLLPRPRTRRSIISKPQT